MIEKILNYKNYDIEKLEEEVINTKDARLLFLYLFFTKNNKEIIAKEILKLKNYRYLHFTLRFFKLDCYEELLNYILDNNDDPCYLYNILYDVDYLDNKYQLKIIDKIISIGNDWYIFKALYYYFIILNLYNEELFIKLQELVKSKLNINISLNNYKEVFNNILYKDTIDPKGFSSNCYQGHKDYIPSIIVCHINNTYNSAIKRFYDSSSDVSSHYVIRRDGHIKQVVSLDDSSWANGTSLKESSDVYYKFATSKLISSIPDNANYFTFSIEHESFDGTLTDKQLESSVKVMKEIIKYLKDKYNYDFIIDREHIIGHNEINPVVRKRCPGSKFPFDKIISKLKS